MMQQYDFMEKRFEELAKYFCLDRKKASMEEVFGDLANFTKDFEVFKLSIWGHMLIQIC